jgi:hypothetical protein
LDFNLSRYKVTLPKLRSRTSNPPRQLIAEINVIPLIGIHDPVVTLSDEEASICPVGIPNSALAAKKPKTIKPANDKILITVKNVCRVLEFLTPRLI